MKGLRMGRIMELHQTLPLRASPILPPRDANQGYGRKKRRSPESSPDAVRRWRQEPQGNPGYSTLLTSLLRPESQVATGSAVNVLLERAVSMRRHGRGGILLVVPPSSDPERVYPSTNHLFGGTRVLRSCRSDRQRSRGQAKPRMGRRPGPRHR